LEDFEMERAAIWIFAGLLTYMCFVLTLINYKIDRNNPTNIQVAALSDVVRTGSTSSNIGHAVMLHQSQPTLSPVHAGLGLLALASLFASWHLSRIYYTHEWTKMVLRKNFAPYAEPYVKAVTPDPLHADQDCVGDPPVPDGRIKDSWLPRDLTRLDLAFEDAKPEITPLRARSGLA
jgi:hypothetical protein